MDEAQFWRRTVVLTALLIAAIYGLPLAVVGVRHHVLLNVAFIDDAFYNLRVMDVARGGTLGNPYLAEHQDAPRFYPELSERVLGSLARFSGVPVLWMMAASRIVFAVAVFLLALRLALDLGLALPWALLAAAAVPLMPSLQVGFLRYFRSISPATHVAVFLLTMVMLVRLWRRPSWVTILVSGALLGLLAYTPFYYWTFAFPGVAVLAAASPQRTRRALSIAFLAGAILATPSILHSMRVAQIPEAVESMARNDQMIPDRNPEPGAMLHFGVAALVVLAIVWRRTQIGTASLFLLAFLIPGAFLFLENCVTGLQMQAWHWSNPQIPLFAIGLGFVAQTAVPAALMKRHSAPLIGLLAGLLIGVLVLIGAVNQALAIAWWEEARQSNAAMALDLVMPQSLAWLRDHTPADSVVLSSEEVMESLPLYTRNRVFWAVRAGQQSISETEVGVRETYRDSAPLSLASRPPYRLDYFLGRGDQCKRLPPEKVAYSNAAEQICIMVLP